jgi:beta-mannosidase
MKAIVWIICSIFATAQLRGDVVFPSWQSVYSDAVVDQEDVILLSSWRLNSSSSDDVFDIPASVPGDLWSDLMHAGLIDDPYYGINLLTQRNVWMGTNGTFNNATATTEWTRAWTYRATADFNTNSHAQHQLLLVVEGIKMGARLAWNGELLGVVTDQFLRYVFPIPENKSLRQRQNNNSLSVTFDPTITTDGRFMGCSGGWDWAPYTQSGDGARGSRVGTLGIVAPVYIVPVDAVYVQDVVCRIEYLGEDYYPSEPLLSGPNGDFLVQVQVHVRLLQRSLDSNRTHNSEYIVCVKSDFTGESVYHAAVAPDQLEQVVQVNLTASKDSIQLWWPNGMGDQPLYNVHVSLRKESHEGGRQVSPVKWIRKRIGFRVVALVTSDDTSWSANRASEGSGRTGMLFRVNGAIVYSRGANMIPMDLLEGRWSDEAHRVLVQSAAAARMNMLRVWGGGAILPHAFYDACDEQGILLYHDLMFVGEQNHSAVRTSVVRDEIRHIVRKLSSHPSIILWSGCNECTYGGEDIEIYESFVMTTVAQEDHTRAIWPSSPSPFGWETGVDTLYGRPNGNSLKVRKQSTQVLEMHGPYNHGYSASYPGVNSLLSTNTYTTNLPPRFVNSSVGSNLPNTFISEFGSSVTSSFESMSATLPEYAWGLHGGAPPDTCHQFDGVVNVCKGTNQMAERYVHAP